MVRRQVTIVNKLGLHARAAARFVTLASRYEADIQLVRDGKEVNAKSIMGVMMLAAGQGSRIELRATGPDAEQAVGELTRLIQDRFGEPE
ncbi:MAG: HPr family phosphocarrier protein [Gammaproteobacteria bacterium]|nr:HPr family phosphocarrier protein [Gammaproteobacteria bacterium]NIR83364.1 HPr family phosphocarrier protein [Gammaproteobacteria bacterium]NIR91164.1 HPr family phosphocarrier protein [Gammaproteobacteria bacterium]NIU04531.1 HPr family phosphocarrier protein [Gammaproteobacteria bacterium]NIW87167.1 HPr family phosphocarrier protein [Gammaproteobacteria bacterium]